jgi:hypothetical protein
MGSLKRRCGDCRSVASGCGSGHWGSLRKSGELVNLRANVLPRLPDVQASKFESVIIMPPTLDVTTDEGIE